VKTRIALAGLQMPLLGNQVKSGQTANPEVFINQVIGLLNVHVDVVVSGIVNSPELAEEICNATESASVDLVVLVAMGAVSPDWAIKTVGKKLPIVIWDVSTGVHLSHNADQNVAHEDTSTVGAVMIGGGLRLAGREFVIIAKSVDDNLSPVLEAIFFASVASRMKHINIARIGGTIPGYITIQNAAENLTAVGVGISDVSKEELATSFQEEQRDIGSKGDASVSLDNAIMKIASKLKADAIAINCHSSFLRDNNDIGIAACLTSTNGIPFSCTGDVATAWLLVLVSELANTALYLEPYSVDDELEAVFLANCGIGQKSMARSGSWKEIPTQFYPGVNGRGTAISMAVEPGAATYVAVRPSLNSWDVLIFEGEVLIDNLPNFGGAYAYFKPSSMTHREMTGRLATEGVVHHGALGLGHFEKSIRKLVATYPSLNIHIL
jgi:L-fucose isomerase-like protein